MYTGWCPLAKHVPPHGTHRPTFQKIDEFPQMQFLDKLMTSVVIQRLVPGRDSADNCEFPQLLEVPTEIPQVHFLDKFDTIVIHALDKVLDVPVVLCNGVPQVHFIDGCDVPVIMQRCYVPASRTISRLRLCGRRSAPHLAD